MIAELPRVDSVSELTLTAELLKEEEAEERRLYEARILRTPLEERIRQGTTWYPVMITSEELGPGETTLLELQPTVRNEGPHPFTNGQVVQLFRNDPRGGTQPSVRAVVAKAGPQSVRLALSADPPDWAYDGNLGVDAFYDDSSYREMARALEAVRTAPPQSRLAELRDILLGAAAARFRQVVALSRDERLNPSQRQAANQALAARDAAFILGPPGTGKTTTLVETIGLAVLAETTTLVCAPSNTAVDLLAERLSQRGLRVLRLGHPVRVNEEVQRLTLDHQLSHHPQSPELKRMRRRAEDLRKRAQRQRGARHWEQRALQKQADDLRRDAAGLERYILNDVLAQTQVYATTLTGAASAHLKELHFQTVFIDEAAQGLEPASWIPILRAERVIFAGDPYQLPPTVKLAEAARRGLGVSLAEKFYHRQGGLENTQTAQMLTLQYRANELIMGLSSATFYNHQLHAHPGCAGLTLPLAATDVHPLEFIDTAGCGFTELEEPVSLSKYNPEEGAVLLRRLLSILSDAHPGAVGALSVGVIAPYGQQVAWLRNALETSPDWRPYRQRVDVRTVDGFQGQERDIIALSLTRSNPRGEVGFLADVRRINVALTRARGKLLVVGDSATLATHPFYQQMVAYFQEHQGYRTAWEIA